MRAAHPGWGLPEDDSKKRVPGQVVLWKLRCLGFPGGLVVKNPPVKKEMQVQSLGQEDPLEKEMATSLQYSCLENSMERRAWWAIVHGVAEVGHDLATKPPPHPLVGFPGGTTGKEPTCQCGRHESWVQSLGREDPLRRAQQLTPVFLPGELHGQRSLAGFNP